MPSLKPLRVLATGGTFDKSYRPAAGSLGFSQSHLPDLLADARLVAPVALEVVMLIDSLDMTDMHRAEVLDACRRAPEPALVIVHGTDTMTLTAEVLAAAHLGKTIVLTGAMVPLEVARSDATFNLAYAMASAQWLEPGVWVAMNGQVHAAGQVRKNRSAGIFEAQSAPATDGTEAG